MTKFALFLGCLIPLRLPFIEVSSRRVMEKLGIELVEMNGAGCCPDPIGIQSIDYKTWLALAARNLCIAEEMNLDILTLCIGCYETLKTANHVLNNGPEFKYEVNEILSEVDKEFKGNIQVKHIIEVLYEDIGPKEIENQISMPLEGLQVATHYGCHSVRPSEIIQFGNPERPTFLDELVEALGAQSVPYLEKMLCCGAGLRNTAKEKEEEALSLAKVKLDEIQRSKADCMTLSCPFCFISYDIGQLQINRKFKERYNLPVFYYLELLGLALGISSSRLGLKFHRSKVTPVLKKLGLA